MIPAGQLLDKFNRFCVCFLDVLGFESRFASLGLGGMLDKYVQLIGVVDARNNATEQWFGPMEWGEGAFWTAERAGFISARLYGTYASDSILLFAHTDFPANRYPDAENSTLQERRERAKDPATGWMYHPVPCDNFLNLCNEMLCRSIEIGLPLRGAISMGEAILTSGIYLGQPLIDAVTLEHTQQCIGASFSVSFMQQIVPNRYKIQHASHFKREPPSNFGGAILDWPRHWRNTRETPLLAVIDELDSDTRFTDYYARTKAIVEASIAAAELYTGPDHTYITKVYPQYSSPLLELNCRPFRVLAVEGSEKSDPDT